jgi:hypothetical protein
VKNVVGSVDTSDCVHGPSGLGPTVVEVFLGDPRSRREDVAFVLLNLHTRCAYSRGWLSVAEGDAETVAEATCGSGHECKSCETLPPLLRL